MAGATRTRIFGLAAMALALALAGQGCAAGPEPLLGVDFWRSPDWEARGTSLYGVIEDVDDLGDVWVINQTVLSGEYFFPALRAEWQGADARAEADLTRRLEEGVNYLVFTLFNKKFEGPSLHQTGGKFRCDFQLYLDGNLIYSKRLYKQYNERKLIFAAVFKALVKRGQPFTLTWLEPEEKARLTHVVRGGLAKVLHDTADEVDVDWRTMAYQILISDPEVKKALDELRKMQEGRGP
ncbi:MAG: hypothetical protein AB1896_09445 [Thermodesulfobacteriota bacterium]